MQNRNDPMIQMDTILNILFYLLIAWHRFGTNKDCNVLTIRNVTG